MNIKMEPKIDINIFAAQINQKADLLKTSKIDNELFNIEVKLILVNLLAKFTEQIRNEILSLK